MLLTQARCRTWVVNGFHESGLEATTSWSLELHPAWISSGADQPLVPRSLSGFLGGMASSSGLGKIWEIKVCQQKQNLGLERAEWRW